MNIIMLFWGSLQMRDWEHKLNVNSTTMCTEIRNQFHISSLIRTRGCLLCYWCSILTEASSLFLGFATSSHSLPDPDIHITILHAHFKKNTLHNQWHNLIQPISNSAVITCMLVICTAGLQTKTAQLPVLIIQGIIAAGGGRHEQLYWTHYITGLLGCPSVSRPRQ